VLANLTPSGRTRWSPPGSPTGRPGFSQISRSTTASRASSSSTISLTQRQAGRTVQRLVEIETYRMMALLGLPVAKEVGRWLYSAKSISPN
jgi:hypothetical protein